MLISRERLEITTDDLAYFKNLSAQAIVTCYKYRNKPGEYFPYDKKSMKYYLCNNFFYYRIVFFFPTTSFIHIQPQSYRPSTNLSDVVFL